MITKTRKRINKWWWIAAAAVVVLFFLFRGCRKDHTLRVSVEKVKRQTLTETVDGSGKINPANEMKLSAEIGSLVTEIYAKEGDTVKQGQVIAVVKTGQTTASSAGGSAPLPDVRKMMAQGNLDPQAIAKALQSSRPATPVISTRQVTQQITAPMSGIISSIGVKKGERLTGTEIARISSAGEWEIRTDVGEVDIVKIKEGNIVEIEPDAFPGVKLSGKVYRIAAAGTLSASGLPGNIYSDITAYRVFISIDPASLALLKDPVTGEARFLRSGMSTTVSIQTRTHANVLTVPIKAVTTRLPAADSATDAKPGKRKAESVVFVYSNNQVTRKKVTTGIQDMNDIEITAGLSGDETVVTDPYDVVDKTLENGTRVKVVEKGKLFIKN